MDIVKTAMAGTLESSDAQVTVEPTGEALEVFIKSAVMNQYGDAIDRAVRETLQDLGVRTGRVDVVDQGALECTLRARVSCAVYRSNEAAHGNVNWGGMSE